ncbi:hypothetical protein [Bacillus sp. JCM 19034]|uniref:hypothetical protein n=1 Tax=Bacillus sp. JCM 19034 TaxID=1481928 RepID=UPI000AC30817|nr:hypothetical protein [Bacillus sp. JCM 19034]
MWKSIIMLSFCCILLVACQTTNDEPERSANNGDELEHQENTDNSASNEREEDDTLQQLSVEWINDQAYFAVEDLLEIVEGDYEFDEIHRTVNIEINNDYYYLIDGVPVLERNGQYVATDDIHVRIVEDEDEYNIYLPIALLKKD